MKSEAYYQGIRARMSELYKLGLEEKNPYIPHSDESIAWFCGWYEAKKTIESVNQSLTIFDESGINLKITIEK